MNPPCQRIRKFKENIMENMHAHVRVYRIKACCNVIHMYS